MSTLLKILLPKTKPRFMLFIYSVILITIDYLKRPIQWFNLIRTTSYSDCAITSGTQAKFPQDIRKNIILPYLKFIEEMFLATKCIVIYVVLTKMVLFMLSVKKWLFMMWYRVHYHLYLLFSIRTKDTILQDFYRRSREHVYNGI